MADPKHVEMIRQGVGTFQAWQARHKTQEIDLSDADLSELDLEGIELIKANLAGANLEGAVLKKAKLDQANLEGAILKGAHLEDAHLSVANLSGADLSHAVATKADFSHANLAKAVLDAANLEHSQFANATLEGALLRRAYLWGANFSHANLSHADLSAASANHASFAHGNLILANLSEATLDHATFDHAKADSVRLQRSQLRSALFQDAVLNDASLAGSICRRAGFNSARLDRAHVDGADFFEANLSEAHMTSIEGAEKAKNLETTRLSPDVLYFETCQRKWPEQWLSWEVIRTIGNLRLFAVSYSLLAFLLTAFYAIGLYNEKVIIARQWAAKIVGSEDRATRLLAERILARLEPFLFSWDTVLLFGATMVLVVGSITYTFGCPGEIKDFTRPQWCYQLNRSLVHYWALAWRGRGWRIACGLLYAVGGLGFVPIIGYKLVRALICVWRYGNISSLVP